MCASDGPWSVGALLDFIVNDDALALWVRDAARFDRDVLRVAEGLPPCDRFEPVAGGWIVDYDRSIIATVNAVAADLPIPPATPTRVRMVIAEGALVVEDAGSVRAHPL